MSGQATPMLRQHEPAPGTGERRVTAGVVALALIWAGVVTVMTGPGPTAPVLSVVALALLVAAAAVVMRASDPLRPAFGSRSHIGVHAMLVAAGL